MDALKALTRLAPAVVLVVGLSTVAMAQPPGPPPGGPGFGGRGGPGGPGGRGGIGMLLRSPDVQSELELLDNQKEQLREIEDEMRSKMREMFGGGRRGGERPDFEAMRAQMEEMRGEIEGRIGEVLSTQQMDRLRQIDTQQQLNNGGARSLMGGPLADKLGLTDEQKAQLREKAQEVQAEMQEKMTAARAEARDKLLEVLTSEQRAMLDEMTGAPFTMSDQPGPPPRGDRAGRRGDRAGGPPEGRPGGRRGGRPGPPPGDNSEL
ncbi:periplasmic repressor CpxP [Botrimarina colliarenosi]|uniref:Periplasmic repressor CpxP n=1 Tax=Botrimarina colliarenosi TaxID=2528001 RepID=A0A5C6AAA9_9BACT|nr:Spy/CpxP family protein refolding chaperone [Botrimarina colliarenosi]TWT96954.1 periplasmic repressor CpxP [Botrimarina colliarenosi]